MLPEKRGSVNCCARMRGGTRLPGCARHDIGEKMPDLNKAIAYTRGHRQEALAELMEFLSIPSISTLPEHTPDVERAAAWVAERMRAMGLNNVEVLPTTGHPVAYGEWLGGHRAGAG